MDTNRDGSITAQELQQTLRKAQAGSEFSLKTVELLISRYDTNGDREISFNEFFDLFNSLNEEFESFLMMDTDGSGSIDFIEFKTALKQKGYNFSDYFFKYIVDEICARTRKSGILFDSYIRVAARFDYLIHYYKNTPYFQRNSLEEYLRKTFFTDFW
jgi:Ca2+-binding EF-hand superfamily protein